MYGKGLAYLASISVNFRSDQGLAGTSPQQILGCYAFRSPEQQELAVNLTFKEAYGMWRLVVNGVARCRFSAHLKSPFEDDMRQASARGACSMLTSLEDLGGGSRTALVTLGTPTTPSVLCGVATHEQ